MSDYKSLIDVLKTTLEVSALLVGAFLFVFVFLQLSATLQLRIIARWIDAKRVILKFEIENKSKVRVKKEFVRLQMLEYDRNNKTNCQKPDYSPGLGSHYSSP
jgi:hypothetical protein